MSSRLFAAKPALLFFTLTLGFACSEPASNGPGGAGTSSGASASGGSTSGGSAGGGAGGSDVAGSSASGSAGSESGGTGGSASGGGGAGGSGTCEESAVSGGSTSVTSLSESCPLSSLSEAQLGKLCDDTNAYVAATVTKPAACKYAALVVAASSSSPTVEELQGVCSAEESGCNEDAAAKGPGVLCTEIPKSCNATVAEYATCIRDETSAFEQGVGELVACSAITFESISDIYDVPATASDAASCKALATACPGFFAPYIN